MYNIDEFLCIIQVSRGWMRPRDAIKVQKELRIRRASLRKHVWCATIALDLGKWSVLHFKRQLAQFQNGGVYSISVHLVCTDILLMLRCTDAGRQTDTNT